MTITYVRRLGLSANVKQILTTDKPILLMTTVQSEGSPYPLGYQVDLHAVNSFGHFNDANRVTLWAGDSLMDYGKTTWVDLRPFKPNRMQIWASSPSAGIILIDWFVADLVDLAVP